MFFSTDLLLLDFYLFAPLHNFYLNLFVSYPLLYFRCLKLVIENYILSFFYFKMIRYKVIFTI
ncbi:hypothetical protein PUN28_001816 [Cardiocondyla obscurior]|uniref:Uncharacterized protein n=1 Tax=Cardiocondyla obscurior TaxID=286306 RepID=A0AAW2GR99_9HYME